jgi:hypothetical protein
MAVHRGLGLDRKMVLAVAQHHQTIIFALEFSASLRPR